MKKILTIHFYEVSDVNLWKDNGGIPYCLSRYYGYDSKFAYLDKYCINKDEEYEKYVKIEKVKSSSNNLINYFYILKYIWNVAPEIDILNFYFVRSIGALAAFVAKKRNPKIIIYSKLDLGKEFYLEIIKQKTLTRKIKNFLIGLLSKNIDLYTVETKKYIKELNKLQRFNKKVKYLPNGYFPDFIKDTDVSKKEKIILTVGRLGTEQKNTEMFVNVIASIAPEKLNEWKVYLVGSITDDFRNYLKKIIRIKPYLKEIFVITGNIKDKSELYSIYARSSVFVLTSRWESWGLVLTEAMRFGCYPIVTNCCDAFDEVIATGKDGFGKIIDINDSVALKKSIEMVLDNKVDYIEKGQKASSFAVKNLNWRYITGQLDVYFNEIYKKRG